MLLFRTIIKGKSRQWLMIVAGALSLATSLYFVRGMTNQQARSSATDQLRAKITQDYLSLPQPSLHVTSIVQHGRIVEITGTTEPGNVVMINGEPAATLFNGNEFRHFVGPLPAGTSIVSITCQSDQGGVNTQQLAITVE
jgi:hypothetical protein